jgi:hypothetical protein
MTTTNALHVFENTVSSGANRVANYTLAFSMALTANSVGVRLFDTDGGAWPVS